MNREKKTLFLINISFYTVIILLILIVFKFLLKFILPFLLAFLICSISRKAVIFLSEKTIISKKWAVSIITILIIFILSSVVYGLLYALLKELSSLSDMLNSDSFKNIYTKIENSFSSFIARFSFLDFLSDAEPNTNNFLSQAVNVVSEFASNTFSKIVSGIIRVLKRFPDAVIFTAFTVISTFYIGFDYDKILNFFSIQLSDKAKLDFAEAKNTFISTVKNILRAYFLLTFITFIQLFCGFSVIKIKYALLLSLLICIVDLLPIFGTGTILIPWSAICFLTDDIKRGIGLIVMYGVITLFRQIAEPKIVGANIGLSPLLSLISMYVGIKALGFTGILIFPVIAITVISLNEKNIIRIYKNPTENKSDKIKKSKHKFLTFKKSER